MNHHSLPVLAMSLLTAFTVASQTIWYSDFGLRMPEGMSTVDGDGLHISPDMRGIGFSDSDGWIWKCSADDFDGCMCSTSWYEPSGQAEDWLFLPAATLDCRNPVLEWRARSGDTDLRDGYSVYVMEGRIDDPALMEQATLLLRVDGEDYEWHHRKVSLDAFRGQEITVAFVNNTLDCSYLCLDDIFIGSASPLTLSLDASPIVCFEDGVALSGSVTNMGDSPLEGFTVTYEGTNGIFSTRSGSRIAPGESVPFSIDAVAPFNDDDRCRFSMTVAGEDFSRVYPLEAARYATSVYAEEGTGMWCGWCVRGIVYMDRMEALYPHNFIGMTVHSRDDLECVDLLESLSAGFNFSTFPRCVVNRNKSIDPEQLPDEVEKARRHVGEPSAIRLRAFLDGDDISVKAGVCFARPVINENRYRLALILMEDSVHNQTYYQNNAYAGSDEDMEGWEKKNSMVLGSELWFRNVSRALITDFEGDPSILPSEVRQETLYEKEYTFTIDAELARRVMAKENLYVVGVLIDSEQGLALNASKTPLVDVSGIDTITGDSRATSVEWYDITGRRVSHPGKGIYIKSTPGGRSRKVVL